MHLLDIARMYVAVGLSVVPILRDGSKAAAVAWKTYQQRLATEEELLRWYGTAEPLGIALVGGAVSGHLEQLDFDHEAQDIFPAWCELIDAEQPGLSDSLHVVATPSGGFHAKYRCPEVVIPGNTKLALDPAGPHILIETRGEGGYCVAPGSPPECHPSGGVYRHLGGPRLPEVVTPAQREIMIRCARSFTREAKELPRMAGLDLRPGDDYDRRGPDWSEILEPHGWKCVSGSPRGERRWRRPDKDAGWSATTGHCRGRDQADLLRVFSSNAAPFEDGKAYGKFRAMALLRHGGDLSAAADELAREGYGRRPVNRLATLNGAANSQANGHGKNGHVSVRVGEDDLLEIPLPEPASWPEGPRPIAYHGLLGDILTHIAPHTEADPVAILAQLLVMFGSVIGRHAHWSIEADAHYGNLYCCLVGDSSVGRKGVSLGRALHAFDAVHDEWARTRIFSGLSSGEGLIWAVRDPIWTTHHVKKGGRIVDTQNVQSDRGVDDKRILVVETEFVRPLQAMQRKGNTLSAVLRQGWDSGNLASVTKNTPARATGAHVSIIGHITRTELESNLNRTEASNGFVNRFLWIASRRSRLLPLGGRKVDLGPLSHKLALAVEQAQLALEIGLDLEAQELFCAEIYPRLNRPVEGLLGSILARGPAQVRRLAMLYALLDFSDVVRLPHLQAALELWDYSERSCRWIFQTAGTGDRLADDVLDAVKAAHGRGGLTQYELQRQVFQTRVPAADIRRALAFLRDRGLIEAEEIKTGGRPAVKFRSTGCAVSAVSAVSQSDESA